ncbi:MAG TPA: HAD family phosphatase [Acidobacteriota bacterium]|jgi:beta-phosphoglucomutase family hydrolase|nr:HAD family phosphatase [Acidobacteriota bacterium]HRV06960.1 HAD family phosphatase [Acidobacteriota bacterium]
MLEGAIFDMDGVLLDNLEYHLEAFQRLGEELGHPIAWEDIRKVFGRKTEDMLRVLLNRELTSAEAKALERRKEEIYRELIRPTLREHIVPGLEEFLEALSEHGIRMAIATSGPPENVSLVTEELGLGKYFEAVVTGDEVTNGKPHPEAFLRAAEKLRLPSATCVVFEDSLSGVQAALAAGCRCVALTTSHSVEELRDLRPHRIVSDFRGLAVEDVLNLDRLGVRN